MLHTYLTLPSALFPDKYQLSSPNFLASNNIQSLRALSGETDLEAPAWAVPRWGSTMLLELAAPSPVNGRKWSASVPLHLRYLLPSPKDEFSSHSDRERVSMPSPAVFWACPTDEGTKMSNNPFDRTNLGYDGLFGTRTMFYHLLPSSNGSLEQSVSVPVLDLERTGWVESGSVGVIMAGFIWIFWMLLCSCGGTNRDNIALNHSKGKIR